jgi:hypothetical protein
MRWHRSDAKLLLQAFLSSYFAATTCAFLLTQLSDLPQDHTHTYLWYVKARRNLARSYETRVYIMWYIHELYSYSLLLLSFTRKLFGTCQRFYGVKNYIMVITMSYWSRLVFFLWIPAPIINIRDMISWSPSDIYCTSLLVDCIVFTDHLTMLSKYIFYSIIGLFNSYIMLFNSFWAFFNIQPKKYIRIPRAATQLNIWDLAYEIC